MMVKFVYTFIFIVLTGVVVGQQACWKTYSPIAGGKRQEHGAAAIGTDIYIVGGVSGPGLTTRVEKYDTTTDKWSTVAPIPSGLHHPNVAAADGKLYLLGGMISNITAKVVWPAVPTSYVFEPSKNTWTQLSNMPNERGSAATAVHGKQIYLLGGLPVMGTALTTVSSFDIATGKFTVHPDMALPEGRDHGGAVVIGDLLYYIGGRVGSASARRNTTWLWNFADPSSKWQSVGQMRTPRGGIGVAAIGTRIYSFGGEGNLAPSSRGVFDNVESFDTTTKKWREETSMKVPRHGTAAVAVGNKIWIPGGGAQGGGGADVDTMDAYPSPCSG
jgi:N-acetylneuraminic acid mutarotase